MSPRPGVTLAIDVGRARVGVARSDPDGLLALPVATLPRESALAGVVAAVREFDAVVIVVGLPLNLSGAHTASTDDAVALARDIARAVSIPVRLVDERLSTVSALSSLRQAGKSSKSAKPVVDQAAAVIILQHCLDVVKTSGQLPGSVVEGGVDD